MIRKVCTSPRAEETRGVMKVVDDAVNTVQISKLVNSMVELKVFMDL